METPGIEPGSTTRLRSHRPQVCGEFIDLAKVYAVCVSFLGRNTATPPQTRHHLPGQSTPYNGGNYIVWDLSVPRPSPPVPHAARARGAATLSLAVVVHMGFCQDPRAPEPARDRFQAVSKPIVPSVFLLCDDLHLRGQGVIFGLQFVDLLLLR